MIENSLTLIGALFVILIAFAWVADTFQIRFRRGLRQLPGPRLAAYSRLWNVLTASSGNAHEIFRNLHEKYGKVVRTGPNHVAIADPALIPVLYGTNNKYLKSDFYQLFSTPYQGETMHSMFSTSDPAQHKALKQAVSNKFSLSALHQFEDHVNECNNIFVSIMHEYAASGQVVDLGQWLQWYAFDVIGAITFNSRFGFMDERRDLQDIIAGIEGGLWYGSICGQMPEIHPWLLANKLLMKVLSKVPAIDAANPVPKIIKMVEAAIEKYDQSETRNTDRSDFLALFRKEGEKSPERMPHKNLMNHLMNNLLAGSDTTGISLRAIFYYLIKNPNCYDKLVQEIDVATQENPSSPNITLTKSYQMPYLQACIKEAMRLHPGVGFPLERVVPQEGLTIGDVRLPAGTIVGMNAWVVHHDKDIYGPNADHFRPERWIDAEPQRLRMMDKCFLSFGGGTRSCIGKNISMVEMGKIVPLVLRNFDVSWASPEENWTIKNFWFAKQTGLLVRFHPRAKEGLDAST